MSSFENKTVLITGGAMGLGKEMAGLLISRKIKKLILWDKNESALKKTTAELKKIFPAVSGIKVDLTDTNQIIEAAEKVKNEIGHVDILINNAGIVVGKPFKDHSHKEVDLTMAINTSALMHVTAELLPEMIRQKEGHIVNIASAAGMVANPKMSVYCASKWAVIGWSDSLRLELEQEGKDLHVTTVTPYYIDTGMFRGVKSVIPILKTGKTARKILKGIERNKVFIRLPGIINWLPLLTGILPVRLFDWFVGRILGVYKSMNDFKGRD